MILIDTIYICQTGGKNLLDLLIDQFEKESSKEEIIFLIDNRIKEFYFERKFKHIKVEFLKGSEFNRYQYYAKNRSTFRKVLCFANVPPPIRLNCVVMTYFQNILLLDKDIQKYFPFKSHLFFRLKGHIIKKRLKNTDSYIVQTSHVKALLVNSLNYSINKIKIIPFFNDNAPLKKAESEEKEYAFFYPATGVFHKNHDRLLQAWSNLYQKGKVKAPLHLTIDPNFKNPIYQKIIELQKEGVPIINHGLLLKSEVDKLYMKFKFVIHPSMGESFGLVLIEALKNNCILLAPDLLYVNAIVKPNYYFNANKPETIEKSVMQAISRENFLNSEILVKNELESLVKYIIK